MDFSSIKKYQVLQIKNKYQYNEKLSQPKENDSYYHDSNMFNSIICSK